jgi:hypothetical protein
MKARAKFLKANAHITKLNFDQLIEEVKKLIGDKADDEPKAEIHSEPEPADMDTESENQEQESLAQADSPENSQDSSDSMQPNSDESDLMTADDNDVPLESEADVHTEVSPENDECKSVAELANEDEAPHAVDENVESSFATENDQTDSEPVTEAETSPEILESSNDSDKQKSDSSFNTADFDQNEIAETIQTESEQAQKAVEEGISGAFEMMPSLGQDDAIIGDMLPDVEDTPVEKAIQYMSQSSKPEKKKAKSTKSSKARSKTTKTKSKADSSGAKSNRSKAAKSKSNTKSKSTNNKKTAKSKKKKSEEMFV